MVFNFMKTIQKNYRDKKFEGGDVVSHRNKGLNIKMSSWYEQSWNIKIQVAISCTQNSRAAPCYPNCVIIPLLIKQ
jgi:hypothetical protein